MHIFKINGPNEINGEIKISGSKNSALPIIFSSLLIKEDIKISNIPKIKDILTTLKIFKKIGVKYKFNKSLYINAKTINSSKLPFKLINKIRASIWLYSTLLIRSGKVKINNPGGCNLGYRPIDLHIYALKKLGAKIKHKNDLIEISIKKLKPNEIIFNKISVGATITAILASILIKGITTIKNCAIEPEITDTINFLNKMGANINGIGTKKIIIKGVNKLHGGSYKIISDRIETGTFLLSATITQGKITCYNINPNLLHKVINKLKLTKAKIFTGNDYISLNMNNQKILPINISTKPYPGFPTDLQPQFTVLNIISTGNSIIKENIFKDRFNHINELNKMGANIKKINDNTIICKGVKKIYGTKVNAHDLRSSASLILAGIIAHGKTIINNISYIYRGYEKLINKFEKIGVLIKKNEII